MKVLVKQKVVDYNVYVAKDGTEFESEQACIDHEKILDGTRIVCPECHGKGGWRGKYIEPYMHWDGPMGGHYEWNKCTHCNGKGYLQKKVTWE